MTDSKPRPREWWIATVYETAETVFDTKKAAIRNAWQQDEANVVRVVEASALEAAQAEVAKLHKKLRESHRQFMDQQDFWKGEMERVSKLCRSAADMAAEDELLKERDQLRAEVAELKVALSGKTFDDENVRLKAELENAREFKTIIHHEMINETHAKSTEYVELRAYKELAKQLAEAREIIKSYHDQSYEKQLAEKDAEIGEWQRQVKSIEAIAHREVAGRDHELRKTLDKAYHYEKQFGEWRDIASKLADALDGADSILVCAGFPNADLMDIVACAQNRISEALAAFESMEKENK